MPDVVTTSGFNLSIQRMTWLASLMVAIEREIKFACIFARSEGGGRRGRGEVNERKMQLERAGGRGGGGDRRRRRGGDGGRDQGGDRGGDREENAVGEDGRVEGFPAFSARSTGGEVGGEGRPTERKIQLARVGEGQGGWGGGGVRGGEQKGDRGWGPEGEGPRGRPRG